MHAGGPGGGPVQGGTLRARPLRRNAGAVQAADGAVFKPGSALCGAGERLPAGRVRARGPSAAGVVLRAQLRAERARRWPCGVAATLQAEAAGVGFKRYSGGARLVVMGATAAHGAGVSMGARTGGGRESCAGDGGREARLAGGAACVRVGALVCLVLQPISISYRLTGLYVLLEEADQERLIRGVKILEQMALDVFGAQRIWKSWIEN